MAGDYSWIWIFTTFVLFIVQNAQSSSVPGGDVTERFAAPTSPSDLLETVDDDWDNDTTAPTLSLEDGGGQNNQSSGNRVVELLGQESAAQLGNAAAAVATSPLGTVSAQEARETQEDNRAILQSVLYLLSTQLSSGSQREPAVDMRLLLPLLKQAAIQVEDSPLSQGSTVEADTAEEASVVKKKRPPPPPPALSRPPTQERVAAAPSQVTKPEPPPRTPCLSAGTQEAPSVDATTSSPTVQRKPPLLPPAKVKRTPDPASPHQSALPLESPQPHTTGPDQPNATSKTATASEAVSVRNQALLLNQDHVLQGMAALARNYAVLGGTHTAQINVKRPMDVEKGESGAEPPPEEPDDRDPLDPQEESNTSGVPEFTRSPYALEITSYREGTLERKKSTDSKKARTLPRPTKDKKRQPTAEKAAGLVDGYSINTDCKDRKPKPKPVKKSASTGDEGSTTGDQAAPTLADLELLARTGTPEQTIQLLQSMLETLKISLQKSSAAAGPEYDTDASEVDPKTNGAGPGLQNSADGATPGFSSILKGKEPKSGLVSTLRRPKDKKGSEKHLPRDGGEGKVLTYLRRKLSSPGSSVPTVTRRRAEDAESDDEVQDYDTPVGSPESMITVENIIMSGEPPRAGATEREHNFLDDEDDTYAEQDEGPVRSHTGYHHVYFSLPNEDNNPFSVTNVSSAVDEEPADDSSERFSRSSRTTVSGSSVDSGEFCGLQGAEGCTPDEQHTSTKRKPGKFFKGLFQKRKR